MDFTGHGEPRRDGRSPRRPYLRRSLAVRLSTTNYRSLGDLSDAGRLVLESRVGERCPAATVVIVVAWFDR